MPAAPMDALGAFSYLSDNLPSWLTRLSDLTAHTAAKHAEFAEAFKKHSGSAPKPRRRKNSSVCSIQTSSQHQPTRTITASQHSNRTGVESISSLEFGNRPALISFRHNLIIHYDAHTQQSLEEMVRSIGTARNNLRKGRMAQLPLTGFRSGRRSVLPNVDSNPSDDQLLSSFRNARTRGMPPPNQAQPRELPFDIADKQLEVAHGLCETAAHNFLRVGDCTQELTGVKEKFTFLLNLATNEVQQLERERKTTSVESPEEDRPESIKSPDPDAMKRPASNEGPIEVDDESASVESIDLSAFRAARRMRR